LTGFLLRELILEGGLAGHMSYPIDYPELTGEDLKDLVTSIFSGKIERMKEKLDGTNLNAYKNSNGDTVFIRNGSDLNSEKGGMSVEEIAVRYLDKPSVADNFIRAAKTIETVFDRIPYEWFNPEPGRKIVVNCECITAGQTNVMIYPSDRVAFHGTSTYSLENGRWNLVDASEGIPDEIRKASDGVKGTEPRPDLIVKSVELGTRLAAGFCRDIDRLFSSEGLNTSATIDDWKAKRFADRCPGWLESGDVYRRWFYSDKSVGLNALKKKYASNLAELKQLDQKEYKSIVSDTMKPLDDLILKIGNALIENLEGFANSANYSEVSQRLKSELEAFVSELKKDATADESEKLDRQLSRLSVIENTINAAEGVVFTYKGRLMKLTGSFSALNQIMGMRKFNR
jgi:hypothetical protein